MKEAEQMMERQRVLAAHDPLKEDHDQREATAVRIRSAGWFTGLRPRSAPFSWGCQFVSQMTSAYCRNGWGRTALI